MPNPSHDDRMVDMLQDAMVSLVRRDGPDLSARQLGLFLSCYLRKEAYTVRELATDLNVSKPTISRALDRLSELKLIRRKVDPTDRRSVLTQHTIKGQAFLRDLRAITERASVAVQDGRAVSTRASHGAPHA